MCIRMEVVLNVVALGAFFLYCVALGVLYGTRSVTRDCEIA